MAVDVRLSLGGEQGGIQGTNNFSASTPTHTICITSALTGPHEAEHPASPTLDAQQFAYHVWVSEIMLQQTQVRSNVLAAQKT